jgi:hypothetical protein
VTGQAHVVAAAAPERRGSWSAPAMVSNPRFPRLAPVPLGTYQPRLDAIGVLTLVSRS